MNTADILRNELKKKNEEIIATRFEPRKEEILNIIIAGIKRIGYVKTDKFNNTGTLEGDMLGIKRGEIDAFVEFITKEGFSVRRAWWGYSAVGEADMLTISL